MIEKREKRIDYMVLNNIMYQETIEQLNTERYERNN